VKYTNNIHLKFWIHMVTEPPALQYVCIHVNGIHGFWHYFFLMSHKSDLFCMYIYIYLFIYTTFCTTIVNKPKYSFWLFSYLDYHLQIIHYPSSYTQYGIFIALSSSTTLHQFADYLIFWFFTNFLDQILSIYTVYIVCVFHWFHCA
jgi:hypothetical protein